MVAMMQTKFTQGGHADSFYDFVSDVSVLMKARAGVTYAQIAKSFHPGMHAPKEAARNGVTPIDFVSGMIEDERLLEMGDDVSPKEAHDYNMAVAAIAEFALENKDDWHRTVDGVYFSEIEEKVLTLRPVRNRHDHTYGFGVQIHDGAVKNDLGTTFVEMGGIKAKFAGSDIHQALEQTQDYVMTLRSYSF